MDFVFEKYYRMPPSGRETIKTAWRIEYYSQVLRNGSSWDDDYPDWEWESTYDEYGSLDIASKKFSKFYPTSDAPIAFLEEVKYDKYGEVDSVEVFDEKP